MGRDQAGNPMRKELHMMIKTLAIAAISAWMLSAIALAQGTVYQGQFLQASGGNLQTTAGGVLSTAGSTWNAVRFATTGSVSLKTAGGQTSTAVFAWSDWTGLGVFKPSTLTGGFGGSASAGLMGNYLYVLQVPQTSAKSFEFSGLPAGTYDLYAYTQGDSGGNNRQLGMSIGTTTKVATVGVASTTTFVADRNYLLFSGITVGSDGKIAGKVWNGSGSNGEANWNGFQLQATSITPTKTTPTITTTPTATAITYGQTLPSSTLSGGVASVAGTFAFTTPSTVPQAGTAAQGVTFTPTDTANYNTVSLTVSVTVAKATPMVTTAPAATGITYGQTLASSTLSGGASSVPGSYAYTTPSTMPATGTSAQPVTFTPTDTANYNTVSLSATVTVARATPTITTTPTASPVTSAQTLASSTLSGGVASVPGTFAFTAPATTPSVGTSSHSVTFTPTDTANYNAVTLTASVTASAPTVFQGQFLPGSGGTSQTNAGGVLNTAGATWKAVRFGSSGSVSLATATGQSSGATFSWSGWDLGTWSAPGGFAGTPSEALMRTYLWVQVGQASAKSFEFSGLWAGTYNLYAYTQGDSLGNNRQLGMSIGTTTKIATAGVGSSSTFVADRNYLLFSGITVGADGKISGKFWNGSTSIGEANWNGFQLQAVSPPPPKTTPTITTAPTPSSITFGQTLASSTLSGGVASVPGTFAYTTSSTAPQAGTGSQSVTFTPTDSLSYDTVSLTVNVTVGKATPAVTTAPAATGITFGQTLASSTLSGGASSVPGSYAFTTPSTMPPAGTSAQPVRFTPTDAANYNTVSLSANVTVAKATPSVTTAPTASAITFGQTLASSTLSGGAASVPGTFAFTSPSTAPQVGTAAQGVTFTPTDTANYNTASSSANVTVGRATPTITTVPVASPISFRQTLASSTLSGGVANVAGTFAFTVPGTAPDVGVADQPVTFTPTDTTRYTSASLVVSVTVGKATPTITTAPTATPVTFGQALANSTLSGGGASVLGTSVPGTFAFTTPGTQPVAGTAAQGVTFMPTDTTRYNVASLLVNVTVGKATPVVTTPPAAASIMFGQTLADGSLGGGAASVPGSFVFTTPSIQPGMGTTSQGATFLPTDAANHNTVSLTVNVTVVKATPTITTLPTATPINFGQTLAGSALDGGAASAPLGNGVTTVAGTFAFATPGTQPPVGSTPQGVLFTPTDTARYNPVSLSVNVPVDWAIRSRSTAATPPQAMTYQGFLTDGSGAPIGVDGPVMMNIVFQIYDAATGGNPVWAERQALAVERGYFTAQLGEGKPLDGVSNAPGGLANAFTGAGAAERYVGITVLGFGEGGADAEILPRTRLTAAPYAYLAAAAASLARSGSSAGIDFSGTSVTVPGTLSAPVVNVAALTVGSLTVSNTLSFSGLAGGFVSSTDGAIRMIAGKHQWTNSGFVSEPSPGYSVTRTGVGTYKITFDTAFKSPPQVFATPMWSGGGTLPMIAWCQIVQATDPTTACREVTVNWSAQPSGRYPLLPKVGDPTRHPNYANNGFPPVLYPTYAQILDQTVTIRPMEVFDGDFSFLVVGN